MEFSPFYAIFRRSCYIYTGFDLNRGRHNIYKLNTDHANELLERNQQVIDAMKNLIQKVNDTVLNEPVRSSVRTVAVSDRKTPGGPSAYQLKEK
jgi:hypothetical protein